MPDLLDLLANVSAERLPGALRLAADLLELTGAEPESQGEDEEPDQEPDEPEERPRPRRRSRRSRKRSKAAAKESRQERQETEAARLVRELEERHHGREAAGARFGFDVGMLSRWAGGASCSSKTLERLRRALEEQPYQRAVAEREAARTADDEPEDVPGQDPTEAVPLGETTVSTW